MIYLCVAVVYNLCVLLFLFPTAAHAYLDLGTGSRIFQVAVASLLFLPFILSSTRRYLSRLIDRLLGRQKNTKTDDSKKDQI